MGSVSGEAWPLRAVRRLAHRRRDRSWTRPTLGHSGRALAADPWTAAIYLAVAAAAVLRVAASAAPALYLPLLLVSGIAWSTAFALFALLYGRIHLSK